VLGNNRDCVYQAGLICVGVFNATYRARGSVQLLVQNPNEIFVIICGEWYGGAIEKIN
jgi:hypothetical protein